MCKLDSLVFHLIKQSSRYLFRYSLDSDAVDDHPGVDPKDLVAGVKYTNNVASVNRLCQSSFRREANNCSYKLLMQVIHCNF